MPLTSYNRDTDVVSITWTLARSAPEAWQHLTSAHHLPEWLGHARSGAFSSGDTLVVDHGDGELCTSVVEALAEDHRLSMSWEFPDEPPSRLSIVVEATVSQQDTTEQCLLRLRHADLGDLTRSYLPGWITHLTYFEGSLGATPLPAQAFWRLYETHHLLTANV